MKARVYLETSFFSFYFDTRTTPEIVARRNWTRLWWRQRRSKYELVTSAAVLEELNRGKLQHRRKAWKLARRLRPLRVSDDITRIVLAYVEHQVMPRDPFGDAFHLAFASSYKCDFLVTWNCEHLANANKFGHVRQVNTLLGLHVPVLVTPLELLALPL
ncbi:MAG: type II toxin-antitoxin system VapC family toxin [Verrucomicrobia bacterium]|nr:type II toxin-antitoxin system VapC family toxin [Verrucomicrobiota bacterium]